MVNMIDQATRQSLMKTEIKVDQIRDPSFPQGREFWLNEREQDDSAPKLLLKISYVEQDVPRLEREIAQIRLDLGSEV